MEKVYTAFLCDCKINKLQQSNIYFHINIYINECFHVERIVYAAFCNKCPYNLSSGFKWFYTQSYGFFAYIVQDLFIV